MTSGNNVAELKIGYVGGGSWGWAQMLMKDLGRTAN